MISSPGDMRICPFDRSHAIKASRFINHVYKCARSHDKKIYSCPYVYDHLFATEDKLRQHLKTCHISGSNKLDQFVAGATTVDLNSMVVKNEGWKFYQDKAINFDVAAAKPPQRFPSPIKPAIRSAPTSSINSALASPRLEEGEIVDLNVKGKFVGSANNGGLNNRRSPKLVRRGRGQGLRKFTEETSKQTDVRLLENEQKKDEIQAKNCFKTGGFQRMNNCYNEISDEDLC
ncbi:hypothetical protein ACOME3_007921 [Neoechinorhynchus agilis]